MILKSFAPLHCQTSKYANVKFQNTKITGLYFSRPITHEWGYWKIGGLTVSISDYISHDYLGTAVGDAGVNDNVWQFPVVAFEENSTQEYIDVTVDMLEVIDRDSDMADLESTNVLHQSYFKNQNPFFEILAEKLPITNEEVYKIKGGHFVQL